MTNSKSDELLRRYEYVRRQCLRAGNYYPESDLVCHQIAEMSTSRWRIDPASMSALRLLDDMAIALAATPSPHDIVAKLSDSAFMKEAVWQVLDDMNMFGGYDYPPNPSCCIAAMEQLKEAWNRMGWKEEDEETLPSVAKETHQVIQETPQGILTLELSDIHPDGIKIMRPELYKEIHIKETPKQETLQGDELRQMLDAQHALGFRDGAAHVYKQRDALERESVALPSVSTSGQAFNPNTLYKNICDFIDRWQRWPKPNSPEALDVISDFYLCMGAEAEPKSESFAEKEGRE